MVRKTKKAKEETLEDLPTSINPYKVLGVETTATADEVRSSYRKQALKHHPGQLSGGTVERPQY